MARRSTKQRKSAQRRKAHQLVVTAEKATSQDAKNVERRLARAVREAAKPAPAPRSQCAKCLLTRSGVRATVLSPTVAVNLCPGCRKVEAPKKLPSTAAAKIAEALSRIRP